MMLNIPAWQGISKRDLLSAYRKAKADVFFDRSSYAAESFATFERDLNKSLDDLLACIHRGDIEAALSEDVKKFAIIPKKVIVDRPSQAKHEFFSDSRRAFKHVRGSITPGFRAIGDFSAKTHIICALWVNSVGAKLDAVLGASAYGSRLRRYGRRSREKSPKNRYHIDALGSFEPYFEPYRAWRDNGLKVIKSSLQNDQPVVAITLDFTSYYHRIDARFVSNDEFLSSIGVRLSQIENLLNESIVGFITQWAKYSNAIITRKRSSIGLPIGFAASRIISNVLLHDFDEGVLKKVSPLYYGRYVDDVFIVLKDNSHWNSSIEVWDYFSRASGIIRDIDGKESEVLLPPSWSGKTKLTLQLQKQRTFFLSGDAGLDLLAAISSKILEVSSERRLMPSPDELERMASAKVLATADQSEEADSLRRADGLSVRRLGWSLQLRSIEILARDLPPDCWKAQREQFYRFAIDHVIRPDRIFEQFDYVPRLLAIAVDQQDWRYVVKIYEKTASAIRRLRNAAANQTHTMNGIDVPEGNRSQLWDWLDVRLKTMTLETLIRSVPWDAETGSMIELPPIVVRLAQSLGYSSSYLTKTARDVREADLARVSYRDHIRFFASQGRQRKRSETSLQHEVRYFGDLKRFLKRTWRLPQSRPKRVNSRVASQRFSKTSLVPFIAPTRPYAARDVTLYLPEECIFASPEVGAYALATYLRALRGAWSVVLRDPRPSGEREASPDEPIARFSDGSSSTQIKLGISSLKTEIQTWLMGASGKPDLSISRYKRIKQIVDLAIKADPQPTHLLLPELALPERWIRTISELLRQANINLISGLDYSIESGTVWSSAVLALEDNRLGYPIQVEHRQNKAEPAPKEEIDLLQGFGLKWKKRADAKPLYCHNNFWFGLLICSELQNVEHRLRYQGNVDGIFVLSWNKDLETFSALVESSALDVHAYIALVNNRQYGDSRVRSPAKKSFDRDICRIRGGENEHLVVVEIDSSSLRAQQSRNRRWPNDEDLFKPAPEGFRISKHRKSLPS